jgi:hypothetical protein
MDRPVQLKPTILRIRCFNSRALAKRNRLALLFAAFALACCLVLPKADAKKPRPPKVPKIDLGRGNTAAGRAALVRLTTGVNNTAFGAYALLSNTTGNFNTATGINALVSNTGGEANTANGSDALNQNTFGMGNTANGANALFSNTTGNFNTANGMQALASNITGTGNTATGSHAIATNTTGTGNTANGSNALFSNTTGDSNTANGNNALFNNTIGLSNTAIGFQALSSNVKGNNNIAVGSNAGFYITGDYNIDIGNVGKPAHGGESYTIRIGDPSINTDAYIAGIYAANSAGGLQVYVNSDGKLGTNLSSARFKQEIENMDDESNVLLSLRPVSFRYKPEIDPNRIPQFGLVAEEVEKLNPALVARDAEGKVLTVRYDAVNAMLLNEFLKEHRKVQEQQAAIAQLQANLAQQQEMMKAVNARLQRQDSEIQQVRARLEVRKSAPHVVTNQ